MQKRIIYHRTAWNYWKQGKINAKQLPSGRVIVDEENPRLPQQVAIYSRVSSSENKGNLEQKSIRLQQYAVAKGYKIYKSIKEVGSGVNDDRKLLEQLLLDNNYNILIVEHKDRLTRFGFRYLELLLQTQGKVIEVVNYSENAKDDLIQDFVSIITSFCVRIYGLRRTKRKTERLIRELENDSLS